MKKVVIIFIRLIDKTTEDVSIFSLVNLIMGPAGAYSMEKVICLCGMCDVAVCELNIAVPITDPFKKSIAQQHRLYMKICRDCGARNAGSSVKCRKCHSKNLRWKKREIVK